MIKQRRTSSLRRQLLAWLLPAMLLLLAAAAVNAYLIALRTVNQAYDKTLLDVAADIAEQVHSKKGAISLDMAPAVQKILFEDAYDHIYYLVLGPNNEFVSGRSDLPRAIPATQGNALFYDAKLGRERLRLVDLATHGVNITFHVIVAETLIRRESLFREIWLAILVPDALLMVLTSILLWFGVRYGLAPLSKLGKDLSRRSYLDLSKIDEAPIPLEVQPLVREINRLLQRLDTSLQAQRAFVSDAAHQIRTPIAALRAQIEVALLPQNNANLGPTLERILAASERIAHLSNQLLSLARAEPGSYASGEFTPVDLRLIAEECGETWIGDAIRKDIDLGFELEHVEVLGSPVLLRELVGNLIDNAIRYTPSGGRVTVRVRLAKDSVLLEVEDNGPGVPLDEQENIFKRFYRPIGSPEGGCGLGLAIVEEIARLHGGKVVVVSPPNGGSIFSVTLPTAPALLIA